MLFEDANVVSPEQLRVDKGDDVLEELVGRPDEEVGSEGFDEGAEEGRLASGGVLIRQQHLHFLRTGFAASSSSSSTSDVVGGGRRRFGIYSVTGQGGFAGGKNDKMKNTRGRESDRIYTFALYVVEPL